jgi:hypothetical protein
MGVLRDVTPDSIAGQDIGDAFLPITTEMRSDMSSR